MAKKPTSAETPKDDAKADAKPVPSQPWAKPSAFGDETAVVATADEKPSEERDQLTPSGDPDAAHELAREEAGNNGGGVEGAAPGDVPAELVDQHTPTGPNPELVDKRAEEGTPDNSPNRIDAETKDQETPFGEDIASTLHQQFNDLPADDKAEFERYMQEKGKAKLAALTKGREAREMAVNIIDPSKHYGNKIVTQRDKSLEA